MCSFGIDQILVRQRYGYKLRGSSLELYGQWGGCDQGYILYLTTYLLPVNNNFISLHLFWSKLQYLFKVEAFFYQEKSYKKMTNLATSG